MKNWFPSLSKNLFPVVVMVAIALVALIAKLASSAAFTNIFANIVKLYERLSGCWRSGNA